LQLVSWHGLQTNKRLYWIFRYGECRV